MNLRITFMVLSGWVILAGCTRKEADGRAAAGNADEAAPENVGVSFTKSIKPILEEKCTICHNSEVLPNRPNFESREGAMGSGMIVPGNPEASRMLTLVEEDPDADKAMPPVSHRLTKEQIALLRTWIAEGADWPRGAAGRVKPAFIPKE
ncbi:MAG: hypothetical protein HKN82_16790 [Akkermansiaceae bacterium]|nr:hypothetical protein [Akkermansiaceae bacterium]